MAIRIRLARGGSKKRPFYSIVAADSRSPRDGRFIEKLGFYDPMLPKGSQRVTLERERIKHWLSCGAKASDRVLRFLDAEGILKREPRRNPKKALPGKKAQERIEEAKAREAEKAEAGKTTESESSSTEAEAPSEDEVMPRAPTEADASAKSEAPPEGSSEAEAEATPDEETSVEAASGGAKSSFAEAGVPYEADGTAEAEAKASAELEASPEESTKAEATSGEAEAGRPMESAETEASSKAEAVLETSAESKDSPESETEATSEPSNEPELPDPPSANSERRASRVRKRATQAPYKRREYKMRRVPVGLDPVKADAEQYLRHQYSVDDEIICQICKAPMPFKMDNGDPYFEKVEFISTLYRWHFENRLALCPNHAAMFNHANDKKDSMLEMFEEIAGNALEIVLAQQVTTIYFTEKHIDDLRAIIEFNRTDSPPKS